MPNLNELGQELYNPDQAKASNMPKPYAHTWEVKPILERMWDLAEQLETSKNGISSTDFEFFKMNINLINSYYTTQHRYWGALRDMLIGDDQKAEEVIEYYEQERKAHEAAMDQWKPQQ